MAQRDPEPEAIVIGAGFGGLGAALRLAERGVRVRVYEALRYPGGCASTFEKRGRTYEAGATLFSGFGEGQLFRKWIDRHGLDVELAWPDPVVTFRSPELAIEVPRARAGLVEHFCGLPGAPAERIRRFFRRQQRVADVLWEVLDDPELLPPIRWTRHLPRAFKYMRLLPLAGTSLGRVLETHGLADFAPLVRYLDALCQITVQCSARDAAAPFALSVMDYYYRGTAHVVGGIGKLAWGLVEGIRACGGEVRFADGVRGLRQEADTWIVESRTGEARAPLVLANLLPAALRELTGITSKRLDRLATQVETGWGACMLYLDVEPFGPPQHFQVVQDPALPLQDGNHLFLSLGEVRDGLQAVTVSTHVAPDATPEAVETIQTTMREGVARFLPELRVVHSMTASPRTFERFTSRPKGFVGGVPRRKGWHNYKGMAPRAVAPGLWMVGDTLFPGQSTLATATGGVRTADTALRRHPGLGRKARGAEKRGG